MGVVLTPRFEKALLYSLHLHAGQLRKGSDVPYIAHLLSVAGIVLENGGNEDEAIAALLHDAVEDQGGKNTLREIAERFGEQVAGIVAGCSDADVIPKPPWRERKEAYIAHLFSANASVRLVSAADKLHNVRSIIQDYRELGEALWERFRGGREGTLWYYHALVNVFSAFEATPLTRQFKDEVVRLEALVRQNGSPA
ncbi:MAG: HD domain-containing protein [Chloroflexi bacterium]|nr:HD domain-containing protein [Anaerolineaceae bacterium]NMB90643.1 HD domain-containing protein [Chloroflexota bacterium]